MLDVEPFTQFPEIAMKRLAIHLIGTLAASCLSLPALAAPSAATPEKAHTAGQVSRPPAWLAAATKVCCLSREKVDGGRRIAPVYRVRDDYCEKGEETVAMKFCEGVPVVAAN